MSNQVSRNMKPKIRVKTGSHCCICDDTIESNPLIIHKTRRQTHAMCEDCGIQLLSMEIKSIMSNMRKNIRSTIIKCPGTIHSQLRNQCNTNIDITMFRYQIDSSQPIMTDLIKLCILSEHSSIYACPNTNCENIIEDIYGDYNLECNLCSINWCKSCLTSPYHENLTCLEYELQETNTENGRYLKELLRQGTLKTCPRCKTPTIKASGCNKMYCESCNCKWCWLCSLTNIDYNHFNMEGTNPCAGKLWPENFNFDDNMIDDPH